MGTRVRRALPVLAIAPVCAVALAACGTATVDPGSAENVIKSQIGRLGPIEATKVSCPSGVDKKQGVSFNCTVTLKNTSNGTTGSGTITLHITNGGSRAVFSTSDIHVQ